MSLSAMKTFKELTGRDLWCTLCEFLNEFNECSRDGDTPVLEMMQRLYKVVDFETASHLFYAIVKDQCSESNLLERIQDSMFRVGWRPSNHSNEAQVWPLVMVKLATDVDTYFQEVVETEKKNHTSLEP